MLYSIEIMPDSDLLDAYPPGSGRLNERCLGKRGLTREFGRDRWRLYSDQLGQVIGGLRAWHREILTLVM